MVCCAEELVGLAVRPTANNAATHADSLFALGMKSPPRIYGSLDLRASQFRGTPRPRMTFFESSSRSNFLAEHDLFRKPYPLFGIML
jgi:hypothetical protein